MCGFNFFLGAVSEIEAQSFSVFPTWLPHHVTYDCIILPKFGGFLHNRVGIDSWTDGWTDVQKDRPMDPIKISPLVFQSGDNELCSPIQVQRGVRQGCPVSGLLFYLVMESFLILPRRNVSRVTISHESFNYLISLYR